MSGQISKHWNRWIMSSVYNHFRSGLEGTTLVINFDNEDPTLALKGPKADSFEFKHLGPDFNFNTEDDCTMMIAFNLMVITMSDARDPFRHLNNVGLAQSLFESCINIKRFGPYPDTDDKSTVTSMSLITSLKTTPFGAFDSANKILRTTVEATYSAAMEREDE